MKKILYIIMGCLSMACLTSCASQLEDVENNPYGKGVKTINIQLSFPDETKASPALGGVPVKVTNSSTGVEYQLITDSDGKCSVKVQYGVYKISASLKGVSEAGIIPVYNVSLGEVKVTSEGGSEAPMAVALEMEVSYTNQLVIKELYFAGCVGGNGKKYTTDSYFSIYNNSESVAYLDSLCFACADSYNAPTKPTGWEWTDANGNKFVPDTIPIIEAVWQFPGNGRDFALQPGEEAIVTYRGAIDHTILNPNSVDLSKPEYFVCYSSRYTLQSYHPSPSPNLAGHWLDLLWKEGKSTAYAFSQLCPTALLFKIKGMTAKEYIENPANIITKRGSASKTKYVQLPSSWVVDGMEVMRTDKEYKRLPTSVDASYVLFAAALGGQGKSLHRKIDEEATAAAGGRIVYQDTNNSANDFEIIDHPSIKK